MLQDIGTPESQLPDEVNIGDTGYMADAENELVSEDDIITPEVVMPNVTYARKELVTHENDHSKWKLSSKNKNAGKRSKVKSYDYTGVKKVDLFVLKNDKKSQVNDVHSHSSGQVSTKYSNKNAIGKLNVCKHTILKSPVKKVPDRCSTELNEIKSLLKNSISNIRKRRLSGGDNTKFGCSEVNQL